MKIADIAIERPVFTLVVAISTIVFGAIGYAAMGIDLYPEIELPVVTIVSTLEGASPEVVELTVTKVIEDEIGTLDQVQSITSQSSFGTSTVIVEFSLEKKIDVAVQEVRDRVAAAQRLLPDDMDPPLIQKLNIADQPIMWLAASCDGDYWALAHWADQVAQDRITQIEGVGAVLLGAFRNRAYRIWLDPERLAGCGLEPLDVADALRREHVELPAGRAEGPAQDISLRVFGEFESADDLGSLILRGGDRPVRLRDVAEVEAGLEDLRTLARFDGRPAIGLGIRKQSGANTVEVAERVRAFLPTLRSMAPPGVEIQVAFDSSRFIRNSITGVQFDIIFGALLTVLVVYLFLRSARATVITALAIPTSLVATFALMRAAGFTMNNLTMLGLSLAVGMVIDDAIVVIENVYRQIEKGLGPREAAGEAMREIGFAVIVSTLSVIAVFVPIAYMRGIVGRFFLQFGLTVAFALFISMVIALTLTPMLASRLLSRADESRRLSAIPFLLLSLAAAGLSGFLVWRLLGDRPSAILVSAAVALFGVVRGPFETVYASLERLYGRLLGGVLRHRWKAVLLAMALFGGAVALGVSPLVKKEFARQADEGRFLVRFEAPLGTSLEATDRLSREVDEVLSHYPEIAGRFVATGFAAGGAPQPHVGLSFVNMVPARERHRTQQDVMAALRRDLNQIPGLIAFVDTINPLSGGQRTTDVQYVLEGPDIGRLSEFADRVMARMTEAGGFVGIDSNLDLVRPEARVLIDRDRAQLLGIPARRLTDTINMLMGGTDVAFFKEGGERYHIRVRAARDYNQEPRDLLTLPIRSRSGALVDLGNVVSVEESVGPNIVPRYNRQRAATLYANLAGKPLGEALEELERFIAEEAPEGGLYTAEPAGTSKTFRDAFRYLIQALALTVIIVYLVLAAQFESFLHPFTIMLSLPLAVTGVFAGLYLTGSSLDIFSFIGIVMLTGIATKNGILLVDYTQHLRAQGVPRDEAIRRAGPIRMRPVLMTATTTAVGMIPVALAFSEGGETRASMGVAVIAGMLSSTPLTLVVIPVVYSLADDIVAWATERAAAIRRLSTAALAAGLAAGVAAFLALDSGLYGAAAGLATALAVELPGLFVLWVRGLFGGRRRPPPHP